MDGRAPGGWFDDSRMATFGRHRRQDDGSRPRTARYGDDHLSWDERLFARTGYAVFEIEVDGTGTGIQTCGSTVTEARRLLRESWESQTDDPWPGHKRCRLKYLAVEG